jgi:hypothetical protein
VIDRRSRRVHVDGVELALTPKEYDLLSFLAESPGAAFTREQIMEAVWDANWFGPTKTLDVHVGALRRKLGDAAAVETVRRSTRWSRPRTRRRGRRRGTRRGAGRGARHGRSRGCRYWSRT